MLNKRSVESLIKGGAFDTLGHPRKGLLQVFEQIIDATLQRRRERDQGVMSLFGDLAERRRAASTSGSPSPRSSSTRCQRLRFEKEMLGLYVSDHPLMGVEGVAAPADRRAPSPTSTSARTATSSPSAAS